MSAKTKNFSKLDEALGFKCLNVGGGYKRVGATFSSTYGFKIPFTVEPLIKFGEKTVGLLFHVVGNLYMVAAYYPLSGAVSVYLIDKGALPEDRNPSTYISRNMELRDVIKSFGSAVVTAFYWGKDRWNPLAVPRDL